mgnify:CR=1 FL=1
MSSAAPTFSSDEAKAAACSYELQSAGGDLPGVLVLVVVLPEVGHQFQQCERFVGEEMITFFS